MKVSKETEYGTVDCWQYEEARLTLEEYEEYLKGLKELESPATLQIMKQMSEMQLEQATATLDREEAEQVQMQILSNIELLLESI